MVSVNDIGMLLAAIAGTLPTMVTADIVSPNGVAVRLVGIGVRIVMVALAAFSKLAAILLTVPAPVSGASQMLALGILFVSGWQTIVHDGLDSRRVLAIGLASALGLGIQGHPVTRHIVGDELSALLGSGVTIGAIVGAITVQSAKRYCSKARAHATRALRLPASANAASGSSGTRRSRREATPSMTSLPEFDESATQVASRL